MFPHSLYLSRFPSYFTQHELHYDNGLLELREFFFERVSFERVVIRVSVRLQNDHSPRK
jgi:hypothetical protein